MKDAKSSRDREQSARSDQRESQESSIQQLPHSDLLQMAWMVASRRVKKDEAQYKTVFLTGLSAYTSEPINTYLKGETSTGKTYIVDECMKCFPRNDVMLLGGMSPKALIYQKGVLVDENGEPLVFTDKKELSNEEREEQERQIQEARRLIDLRGKILVFLESPPFETLEMLKPILSHDKMEIEYQYVDKVGNRNKTQKVILRGWPATIFCSAKLDFMEELVTRGFTITPESSIEKIKLANQLTAERMMYSLPYEEEAELEKLRQCIGLLKQFAGAYGCIVPYADKLVDIFPYSQGRDMRDFKRFLALIKLCSYASPNFCHRILIEFKDKERESICLLVASQYHFWVAQQLYGTMWETTRLGIPRRVVDILDLVKRHGFLERPLPTNVILELAHNDSVLGPRNISKGNLKKMLQLLENASIIDSEECPEDKRKKLYTFHDAADWGKTGDRQGNNVILPSINSEFMKKLARNDWGQHTISIITPDGKKISNQDVVEYTAKLCECKTSCIPLSNSPLNFAPFEKIDGKISCIPNNSLICPLSQVCQSLKSGKSDPDDKTANLRNQNNQHLSKISSPIQGTCPSCKANGFLTTIVNNKLICEKCATGNGNVDIIDLGLHANKNSSSM